MICTKDSTKMENLMAMASIFGAKAVRTKAISKMDLETVMGYGAKGINKQYPISLINQLSAKKPTTHKEYSALELV